MSSPPKTSASERKRLRAAARAWVATHYPCFDKPETLRAAIAAKTMLGWLVHVEVANGLYLSVLVQLNGAARRMTEAESRALPAINLQKRRFATDKQKTKARAKTAPVRAAKALA